MLANTFSKAWLKPLLILPILALAACGDKDPKATPTNLVVTPGDGRATVTWNNNSNSTYRVFKARAGQITPANYTTFPEPDQFIDVRPPFVVTGLTNGQIYSFTINAASSGGVPGDAAPSQAVQPRPAGDSWSIGKVTGTADLNALINFNGTMISAGNGGGLYSSVKGDNWNTLNSGINVNLRGLLNDGARLVAVGDNGVARISNNPTSAAPTWKATDTKAIVRLNSVAYSGSTYVAVGIGGTLLSGVLVNDPLEPGTQTINWTALNANVGTSSLNKVAFLNGQFVVLGNGGIILTSTDAINWTARNSTTTSSLNDIAQTTVNGAVVYVVVGNGGTVLQSPDLASWTRDGSNTLANLNTIVSGSRLVIGGAGGIILYGNGNGAWTLTNTANSSADVLALANSNGGYVGVGANGRSVYSY
ncbi:hypothetical protein ACUHMQ_10795 [Chitinimonas sp. PSY-7]|uniref:hypothetical protein n=1 Tax=Chitinimonas sp. PSY-7 TaxID=3459088 RepID=UPI00403FE47F